MPLPTSCWPIQYSESGVLIHSPSHEGDLMVGQREGHKLLEDAPV